MKLLLFEKDIKNLEQLCMLLNTVPKEKSIDKTLDQNKLLNMYKKNRYDLVFINCNHQEGIDLKKEIRLLNPKQKVIAVNNTFNCAEPKGCEYCKESTSTLRIFEPYNIKDIVNAFKDVQCEHDYCNDDIETKLVILSKEYHDIIFNAKNKSFSICAGNEDLLSHHSVVDLSQKLKSNNIPFVIEKNALRVTA